MEKIIHEVKIIETDDGYRIEIKGDKARLKEMFERMPFGFRGAWGGPWEGRRGRRRGWHRGGFHYWERGPWGWHFERQRDDAPPEGV